MKRKFSICFLLVMIVTLVPLIGAKTGWGGTGEVNVRLANSNELIVDYLVTEGRGTGTASFQCEIISPEGNVFSAQKASSTWNRGVASCRFNFPRDFRGNDAIISSQLISGEYLVLAYWYIDGYGVNGKVAACYSLVSIY
ncbi:hypothetical protein [uncultured Sphaerochaeta sp.]|uniref:hypothetical protein n=1 Tax=uncultured Sphaerochaeta sp. TaxID=886478 RepID=UPI002A0A9838|nr:hypothetical protein [uncultured Sphaerochaeta sp.]